jgi:hypothetical protein
MLLIKLPLKLDVCLRHMNNIQYGQIREKCTWIITIKYNEIAALFVNLQEVSYCSRLKRILLFLRDPISVQY